MRTFASSFRPCHCIFSIPSQIASLRRQRSTSSWLRMSTHFLLPLRSASGLVINHPPLPSHCPCAAHRQGEPERWKDTWGAGDGSRPDARSMPEHRRMTSPATTAPMNEKLRRHSPRRRCSDGAARFSEELQLLESTPQTHFQRRRTSSRENYAFRYD